MFLITALLALASAGTVLRLDDTLPAPDPDSGWRVVTPEEIAPDQKWTTLDEHAMRRLGEEILAVRPLMHQFDGELEIISRLAAAVAPVEVLRDDDERRLLYQALAFQGFAVERYFQGTLATDPAAEPYRVVVGDRVEVRAWVDAVALDPYHDPDRKDISEEPELSAFRETRARLLFARRARVAADGLPSGATLLVDGRPVPPGAQEADVLPGRHYAAAVQDGRVLTRARFRVGEGETRRLVVPPSPADLDALSDAFSNGADRVSLSPSLADALGRLPGPVRVSARGPDGPAIYRVSGAEAIRDTISAAEPEDDGKLVLTSEVRLWAGAALFHDDTWLTQHEEGGAPREFSTSNGVAPSLGLSVLWKVEDLPVVAGVGCDLFVPTGEWQWLRTRGGGRVRARVQPHLAVGIPEFQVNVGMVTPWHATLGVRGALPIAGDTRLMVGGMLGLMPLSEKAARVGGEEVIAPRVLFIGITTPLGESS